MALYRSLGARPDDTRGTTALEVRKDLARLFTGPGVLPGADSPLVVGSDVFAYVVRTAGWVTSRGEGDGVHLWGNDGDHTITGADDGSSLVAPAPGLSRIDVIYALHPSASENGDTTSEPLVAVRKGVEASVPVAPSLPVGGLELGRNTMTSAATSTSSAGNTIAQTVAQAAVAGTGMRRVTRTRTSAVGIPHAAYTLIGSLNEVVAATGVPVDDFSTPGNSYVARFDGWAEVSMRLAFDANPTGVRLGQIRRNGGSVRNSRVPALASLTTDVTVEWEGPVSDGDTFEAVAWQDSGASLSLVSATFTIKRTA